MYLSSIDLFGFKSFAHRTRINFSPGITAIVGPNGCGKSNLVDAVRWVLGEQRESALRSDRMENVIFGGSGKKRPLGMAEISLTIQDADGDLPLEFDEVTVTRRLFRSGKSEYLMNKGVCRLKDLTNLFVGSGVGADAYSIMELKMVEDVLSDNPEKLRFLLDEAMGVTRYKVRRKEALRKLDAAHQDRERALDILQEVEKQTRNLKRQVSRVTAYKRLQSKAQRTRAAIVWKTVQQLEESLKPLNTLLRDLKEEREKESGDLSAAETSAMRIEEEILELESARQKDSGHYSVAQTDLQALTEQRAKLEEEIHSIGWRLERNQEEEETIRQQLKLLQEQVDTARSDLDAGQSAFPALETRYKDLQTTFEQVDRRFKEVRTDAILKREALNTLRAEESRSIRDSEQRATTMKTLEARREDLIRRQEELKKNAAAHEDALSQADLILGQKSDHLLAVKKQCTDAEAELDGLHDQIGRTERELSQSQSRVEQIELNISHLKDLHRRSSPLYTGGGVLASQFPDDISAALTDELQVEAQYIRAVETALRGMAYARVINNPDTLRAIIDTMHDKPSGQSALLIGDPPAIDHEPVRAFVSKTGGRLLAEVIEGESRISSWVRWVLRRTVLVESFQEMSKCAPSAAERGVVLVTTEGEFTDGCGFWVIGSAAITEQVGDHNPSESAGVSAQLEKFKDQLTWEEKQEQKLQKELSQLQKDVSLSELKLKSTQGSLKQAEGACEVEKSKKLQIDAQLVSSRLLLEQVNREREEILLRIETASRDAEGGGSGLPKLAARLEETENELRQLEEQEAEVLDGRETARQQFAEIQVEYARAQGEIRRVQDRVAELNLREEESSTRIDHLRRENDELKSQQVVVQEKLAVQYGKIEEAALLVRSHREKLDDLESRRLELQETQRVHSARVRSHRSNLENLADKMHHTELQKVEIEAALREERKKLEGINLDDIADESPDPELLAKLERRIISLEPLNLAAEREYREQEKRLEFLKNQLKDLEEAEESLQRTVNTLNQEARERFETGYEKIRDNFKEVFRDVFEGGQAELKLVGEDPLESRVEILVAPPGKRIGALTLLSGGEKTLTAISLLFAIYMEKPSPFCILDEVDAPLDDENTTRFCKLLGHFSPRTQFLVVTHNKRTMEVAQQLLGITMEEEGVSKVVPVKLN